MGDRGYALLAVVLVVAAGVVGGGVGVASPAPIGDDASSASGGAAGNETTGIHSTNVSGSGYIDDQSETVGEHPGPAFVWSTEPLAVNATLGSVDSGEYVVCASATNETGTEIADPGCQTMTVGGGNQETASFTVDWPADQQGSVWITIEAEHQGTGERYYETVPVTLLQPEGDLSGDGLTNAEEVEHGTDFTTPDTSGNGLTDWEEVKLYGTDPLETDTTGDGVSDTTLVQFNLDPTQPYILHLYVAGALVLFALLVVGGGALGWRLMRRRAESDDEEPAASTGEQPSGPDLPPEPSTDPAPADAVAGAGAADEPPLTKKEEICRLLREHAGRMKQSELVEQTEWSQATVSRLLSQLEQEGTVTKLRVGRENIVELREEQPPDA